MTLALLIATLFSTLILFGTGFSLRKLCLSKTTDQVNLSLDSMSCSVLYATLVFSVLRFFSHGPLTLNTAIMAGFTLLIPIGIALGKKKLIFTLPPLSLVVLAFVIIAVYFTLAYPHVLDCGQLSWTQAALQTKPLDVNSGALGFSSLAYVSGLLTPTLPLATAAAGLRPLLFGLFILTLIALARSFGIPKQRWPFLILATAASYFFLWGIVHLGKDSMFAVLFSLVYIAHSLPHKEQSVATRILAFAAATLTGAITIPYLVCLAGLQLLWAPNQNERRHILYALIAGLPGIILVAIGMLHLPLWMLLVGSIGGIALLFVVAMKIPCAVPKPRVSVRILFFLIILGCWLMPVASPFLLYQGPQGPIYNVAPPLDGHTTFPAILLAYPAYPSPILILFGLCGMLIGLRKNKLPQLTPIILFPWVIMVVGLILAHLPLKIVSPFFLADLIKDIPLWYGGPLFGIFAFYCVEQHIPTEKYKTLSIFILTLCCILINLKPILGLGKLAYHGKYAGHENHALVTVIDTLWATPNNDPLYIDLDSAGKDWYHYLGMYLQRPLFRITAATQQTLPHTELYIITNKKLIQATGRTASLMVGFKKTDNAYKINTLLPLPYTGTIVNEPAGEGLYLLRK